jgi:predicted ATPase
MPTLEELETQYTHRKTLGLLISEEGFGRPWATEDISDGTIQFIALLAATFDPRSSVVMIEEPENSIHPWAIRKFIEAARESSKLKQVFLTTHSPILIDQLTPNELWVVRRPETETLVDPVLTLDPHLESAWGEGNFTLSEYLDSGIISEAIPTE